MAAVSSDYLGTMVTCLWIPHVVQLATRLVLEFCYERPRLNTGSFLGDFHGLLFSFTPLCSNGERVGIFPSLKRIWVLLSIEKSVSLYTLCGTRFPSGGLCFMFYQASHSVVISTEAEIRSTSAWAGLEICRWCQPSLSDTGNASGCYESQEKYFFL